MVENPYFFEDWEEDGLEEDSSIEELSLFHSKRPTYEEFSNRLKWLIEALLKDNKVNSQNIASSVKDIKSIIKKVRKKGIKIKDMQDIVRVRIITYLKSDADKVSEIIKKEFMVDEKLTRDYSKILEVDEVGYRAKNFVVSLNKIRKDSSEWKNYADIRFEIQVHTMLENAWSEIQHDRNYKFSGELPEEMERKFSLLAGSLELLDINFDELCSQVDNYEEDVKEKFVLNRLSEVGINSLSLGAYFSEKFKDFIGNKIEPKFQGEDLPTEMVKDMKISNLKEVDEIINSLPMKDYLSCQTQIAFSDLTRDILLMKFGAKLIEVGIGKRWDKVYRNIVYSNEELKLFRDRGVDLEKISKENNLLWAIKDEKKISDLALEMDDFKTPPLSE